MKKLITLISLILCMTLIFAACSAPSSEGTTQGESSTAAAEKAAIRLGLLKGPTGMGAAYLLEKNSLNETTASYDITLAASADVLQSALINGEADIAALPTNVAAVLYGKTQAKVKLLAVNTLGVIYIMSNSEDIKSLADLKGKTVYSAGQGTTTEYVLNYILEKNGLKAGEDVTIEYASEHAEVVSGAKAGNYSVILLPEPFVTQLRSLDSSFTSVIDLSKEWENSGGSLLTMGCVAVRSEFAESNPEAVSAFLADYEASVKYVNENNDEAAQLIEKFEIAAASVAQKALPYCNITFMTGSEMKENVSAYLKILSDFNIKAVGGALPAEDFYFAAQ